MKYAYFVKEKSTGKFKFFKSIGSIISHFSKLSTKKSTITNRFREMDKEKQPTVIKEWGYQIYRTKKIE